MMKRLISVARFPMTVAYRGEQDYARAWRDFVV